MIINNFHIIKNPVVSVYHVLSPENISLGFTEVILYLFSPTTLTIPSEAPFLLSLLLIRPLNIAMYQAQAKTIYLNLITRWSPQLS